MRLTFEYNDDERHMVKWILAKVLPYLGYMNDLNINYQNKTSLSNVWEIPEKFKDLIDFKKFKEVLK